MGAEDVENHIQPSEEARQKAADNLTKGRRRAQIKRGEASTRSEQRELLHKPPPQFPRRFCATDINSQDGRRGYDIIAS